MKIKKEYDLEAMDKAAKEQAAEYVRFWFLRKTRASHEVQLAPYEAEYSCLETTISNLKLNIKNIKQNTIKIQYRTIVLNLSMNELLEFLNSPQKYTIQYFTDKINAAY